MMILTDGCVQLQLRHPSNKKIKVHNKRKILYLLNEESVSGVRSGRAIP